MDIQALIALVQAHWIDVLALIGAIDLALGIVTKWTPSKWDDNAYAILHSWTSRLLGKGK